MVKIAICEDNSLHMIYYSNLLHELAEKMQVPIQVTRYENGKQLLFELSAPESQPDIIYLDIVMPNMDGIMVAQKLREQDYTGEIVFLTQSNQHFLPAFDVKAFNYVVKKENEDRFARVFQDVITAVEKKEEEYMLFTCCGEVRNIPVRKIKYFASSRKILTVYYEDGEFEFYSTMGRIEEQLFNKDFIRIHKSFLVSLRHIHRMSYNELVLQDQTVLPVGRTYYKALKDKIAQMKEQVG